MISKVSITSKTAQAKVPTVDINYIGYFTATLSTYPDTLFVATNGKIFSVSEPGNTSKGYDANERSWDKQGQIEFFENRVAVDLEITVTPIVEPRS